MFDYQNLAAVQLSVLGGLICEPGKIGEAMSIIKPEMFPAKTLRPVYNAMCRLFLEGAPVDAVSIRKITGEEFGVVIDDILKCVTSDALWYCAALRDYSKLENLVSLAAKLGGAESIESAMQTVSEINGAAAESGTRKIISAADAVRDNILAPKEKREYIRWGIPQLDEGLYTSKGSFVVIGGRPSAGKTMFALQLALTMAAKNRVGFFSLETDDNDLADRIAAYTAQVSMADIMKNQLGKQERASVESSEKTLRSINLDLIPISGLSVDEIQSLTLSRRYDVIFVDYLQIIANQERDIYKRVTNISMALHIFAQRNKVLVVALAQLSRPEKGKNGKLSLPTLASLRESGQIEQDADVVMLLYLSDPNDNSSVRRLRVAKNKRGRLFEMELTFDGATQTFRPIKRSLQNQINEVTRNIKTKGSNTATSEQIEFCEMADGGELPF